MEIKKKTIVTELIGKVFLSKLYFIRLTPFPSIFSCYTHTHIHNSKNFLHQDNCRHFISLSKLSDFRTHMQTFIFLDFDTRRVIWWQNYFNLTKSLSFHPFYPTFWGWCTTWLFDLVIIFAVVHRMNFTLVWDK